MEILNVRALSSGYLVNGHITVLPADADYSQAEAWVTAGKEVMPQYTDAELEKQIIDKMKSDGEAIIEAHIQAPIDAYNEANGVKFAHAHSCANYKDEAGYTHQSFCQQAWSFNVAVWEAGRLIQVDVLAETIPAPTPEEFKAMLPVFGA